MRRERGALEQAVLDVLWDHGGWPTPAEVGERLDAELAYTTVVTVLGRLLKKGTVDRTVEGRGYVYRPCRTREQQAAVAMAALLAGARDPVTALNHFVESMADEDRLQLSRLLRRWQGTPRP